MKINTKIIAKLLATSVVLAAGAASAGSVDTTQVTMVTVGSLKGAKGTFKAVRNSSDSTQYIGCSRYAYASGSTSINCTAIAKDGTSRSCSTSNNEMLRVAENLNPASYLFFVVAADGTSCDRVIAVNDSSDL